MAITRKIESKISNFQTTERVILKKKTKQKHPFCTAKEIINKMKRQPTEWENLFSNHISNKGLISKMYKEFIKVNSKKNPI